MANINEILARAAALRDETALNSISPERAGGIMYDTLIALNELWLQQGAALVISKIYASVAAMEADTDPISDLTGQPIRPGQIVVIVTSDTSSADFGSVYRFDGIEDGASTWSLTGKIGSLPVADNLTTDNPEIPLSAAQGVELNLQINGETIVDKGLVWEDGYVSGTTRTITSSSSSKFCQPVLLRAGEKLSYKTGTTYSGAVVQATDATPVAIGDTLPGPILVNYSAANTVVEYIASTDMYIVISCQKASNEIFFKAFLADNLAYPHRVPITAEYFNLHDNINTGVLIRANLYMPYNGGCIIEVKRKETTNYQYYISAVSVNSSHVRTETTICGYTNTSAVHSVDGNYNYILMGFKNGDDAEVAIADVLSAYNIIFHYKDEVPSILLKENERKWDYFGAFNQASGRGLLSDYLAIPKQFMKVRFDMPEWMRVRFRYGLRNYDGWTGYYYAGDIVTFTRAQSAIRMELTLIDERGLRVGIYDRKAVGHQMSLTILDENDKDIYSRNFAAEKYLGAIRTTPGVNSVDLPMIVHASDIHGDGRRFNSAFDYADYIGAKVLVNTGDNPFYVMENGVMFHENIVKAHKTDFANCLGNHDTYDSTLADIYNKNIAPFATDYGYHKSSGSDVTDKCYFYKDLSDCNLRIIVLNIYEDILTAAYKARVTSTQFNWFISTLASTPAGYGVIVVMHQAPHPISAVTGKTDFNDSTMEPQTNAIDSDYMTGGKIIGNPFGKVIDAFISKGSVSGSYTQKNAAFTADETISYSADFTNLAESVEFIAYLNGHTHRDYVGYVSDCEHNQLNLNVCAIPPISQSTGYKTASDIFRDSAGANQDAFNIYTINRTDKTVGVARIGSNMSHDFRPRKAMFISYV